MSETNASGVLNHLIETCRDGAKGFAAAAELVADAKVKTLFTDIAAERARFAEDLVPYAQRLGGATAPAGSTGASMHRRWMDLRSAISGHDDRAVLAEVLRGDNVSVLAFKTAVDGALPMSVRDVVERQYTAMRQEHERFGEIDKQWRHG